MTEEPITTNLPPPTTKPCDECPWRRASTPGYVGPHNAQTWRDAIHGDAPIACHKTITADGETTTWTHQCAGAAIYRSNVHKLPRDPDVVTLPPDRDLVFARDGEFLEHHDLRPRMMRLRKWMLEEWSGLPRSRTKEQMVNDILSYGAPTHHATLRDYEELL